MNQVLQTNRARPKTNPSPKNQDQSPKVLPKIQILSSPSVQESFRCHCFRRGYLMTVSVGLSYIAEREAGINAQALLR